MTEKKKSPGAAGKKKPGRKPVVTETAQAPGVAMLIESELQRAEVVLAAKGMTQKLQDIAENLSKMEAGDIMPMLDGFRDTFGPQAADQFGQVATAQVRDLITAVQTAKNALDNEIVRLEQVVNGADASDAALGVPPPAPAPAPEPPLADPAGGAPDMAAEMTPPTDADAMGASGFAGRERKESATVRGRRLTEETVDTPPPADPIAIETCLDVLANFSPKCFSFAHDILDAIDNLAVSGDVRSKLTNALGHLMSMATTDTVWDDPDAMVDLSVEKHLVDGPMAEVASSHEIKDIFKQMRKLAHMMALKHGGHLSEDELLAAPAAAPVAPATPAARPLAAGPVFESQQRKNIKRLREASDPDRLVLKVFRNVYKECKNVGAAVNGTARAFAIDAADVVTIIREAKAAARKSVREDAVPALMGVEMGREDPDMPTSAMSQHPTHASPEEGKPNGPMTPADMRAQRTARQAQDQAAGIQPKEPIVDPKQPLPVQQVKPVAQPKPDSLKMPGRVVNAGNVRTV
jgi:hypothetical protein